MHGNSAGNSLGGAVNSAAAPGMEAPSPFFRRLEQVLESRP